jgi:zinc/manganese transport system substrate-binding protein
MSFRWTALCTAALVAATAGPAGAELRVVATSPDLASLAREVGGRHVAVTALALATQDLHFVDAKPSLALELNRADLLLAVGMQLEVGWLPILQLGARNPTIQVGGRGFLDCSTLITPLDVATTLDRSQGDIHPGGNPHYLHDPRRAAAVARGIAARLAELDPSHEADFKANLDGFLTRVDQARARWEKRLAPLHDTPVVTYHKSFVYLSEWLGLDEVGYLEPKPGVPPSASHVARLLQQARARKVKLVVQESFYPEQTAKLLASKIPAALVRVPSAADFRAGQSYLDRMDALVDALAKAARLPEQG